MAAHNDLGNRGESEAAAFLKTKGYTILEQNWRFLKAEIDIIALIDNWLCIVEVKTRSSTAFGNPETFVSYKKQQLLIEAAHAYVIQRDLDLEVRFDVISIIIKQDNVFLEHFIGAFKTF